MHSTAGSPTESSFAMKHAEKSEQHEKVEKAKLASLRRSRSSQTSLVPPDLPPTLAAQLVTVSDPRDILSAHLAANDRRLRRLICRYTNQIQYGCQNIYCTVPSCLTCRQRKSRTPVRKYTDASARALAAHLIDEHGDKGLCHSDPVVPWFETPGTRPRTRSGKAKLKSNGHAKEPANGHSIGPGHIQHHASKSSLVRPHSKRTLSSESVEALRSEDKAKNVDSGPMHVLATSLDVPGLPVETTPIRLSKKDPKSFTQAIFDSLGLRSLWANSHPSNGKDKPTSIRSPRADALPLHQEGLSDHAQDVRRNGDLKPDFDPINHKIRSSDEGYDCENANGTPLNRPGSLSPHSLHEKSSECAVTRSSPDLPGSLHQYDGSVTVVIATESDRMLESKTLPGKSGTNTMMPQKPDVTDLEAPSHENDDGTPTIRVISLLSYHFLIFLIKRNAGKIREDSMPWSEKGASEPYRQFARNSIFFSLRSPQRTLRSIRDWHEANEVLAKYERNDFDAKTISVGIRCIAHAMPIAEVLRTVRLGLRDAYNPPLTWKTASPAGRKRSHQRVDGFVGLHLETKSHEPDGWLSDEDTARLCAFGLLLLHYNFSSLRRLEVVGTGRRGDSSLPLGFVRICNSFANVFPTRQLGHMKDQANLEVLQGSTHKVPTYRDIVGHMTELIDYFEDYDAKRLFSRIADIIAARHTLAEMSKSRRKSSLNPRSPKLEPGVAALIASYLASYSRQSQRKFSTMNITILTIEWIKLLFRRDWDGNAVIRKASPLGGSLELLMAIFLDSREYAMAPAHFYMPLLADRLNMVEMPVEWLSFRADNKHVHLLSYSFLFEPQVLVSCFRAINYSKMSSAAADARAVERDIKEIADSMRYPRHSNTNLRISLMPYMATNFVMTVRRDNILEDAINQVWRRQRRELMRPLKVRMGMDEGEMGVDIGGIQQEFFRILLAQVLDPEYGMFTIDDRTRMTYFKPGAVEPLYKFEVVGVLMSLAIYNSITLPITFPLAFYRKLLGLKVKKVHHIADGWPELAKGLEQMLTWTEGDVSDVFSRTFEFSYEAFGKHVNINMKRFDKHTPWPPSERKKGKEKMKTTSFELPPKSESLDAFDWAGPEDLAHTLSAETNPLSNYNGDEIPDDEAPLVTNADRDDYVRDYIIWLTHRSVEQQYKAFSRGFYACLDRTALSIFTPEALKAVVEGYQEIDVDQLEAATKYEDSFDEESATIQDFWHIVRSFNPDQIRHLLEFVTASDRVPVNGIKSIQFIIQRNGSGDERLPTSMTCFGRLLLPQYSSRSILEEKLTKAIENSAGFGVA
jgi:HECT-domain (ubiquitin-transferase)/Amino-terminal Zinc-binding domain of ubiquitin ligase E3A